MQEVTQFTVFLENKPGRLHHVCAALAKEKANITAMTVMDSKDHSVLRFVVDRPELGRQALKRIGADSFETPVTMIELKNHPGAAANLCGVLAAEHVNIDYLYCSSGAKNGRTLAILKATPLEKLRAALEPKSKPKKERLAQRRPPAKWK